MVNEEILNGIKLAVNRGESLSSAMLSFFNAGYKKEEIEEAAKVFQQEFSFKKPVERKPKIKQKVSAYEEKTKPVKKAPKGMLIAIIILFLIALGLGIFYLLFLK